MKFKFESSIIFLILFIILGCQNKNPELALENIPVKVAKVILQQLDEAIDYVGNISAQDEAVVYPKVSGKIIEKLKEDGSLINKGEALCFIDRDETGLKFERAPVESPLSGIVGRFYLDIGVNVTSQSAIALVVNMDKVKIDLAVTEKYLPRISLGQDAKVKVDAWPGQEFVGKVTKVSPVLDMSTRSAPVEITLENPEHQLQSGMFANVSLILKEHKNIPVILKEAVIGKTPETYVYVIEKNKALLRKVNLGLRQGPYFAVEKGLSPGDAVVVMGQQRLFEGAQVTIEE